MQFNLKLIAMLASVFFAGIIIRGEYARRQDLRRELREIKDAQTRVMARVDSINANYAVQKLDLALKTDSLYLQIGEIIKAKNLNRQRINEIESSITSQRQQLSLEIYDLKKSIQQHPIGVK